IWSNLRGERIFLTGGTGFIGSWMAQSFAHANSRLGLQAKLIILTRRQRFSLDPAIEYCRGDISNCEFPAGVFSHVLHAASPSEPCAEVRVIDFAASRKLVYLSSGAIYGTQTATLGPIAEDREINESEPTTRYAHAKRAEEKLFLEAGATVARGFAFLGPGL